VGKFTKGKIKTGGRAKESKNKKTLVLDAFAKTIIEGGMEKFHTELMSLKGALFVNSFMSIFEYVQPKLQRSENVNKNVNTYSPPTIIKKGKSE
jgi:hypothetical protein